MAYKLLNKDDTPMRIGDHDVFASPRGGCLKAVDKGRRLLHMIGTDEGVDRDGDIIEVKGWMLENYLKNPVFLWMHDRSGVPLGASQKITRRRNPSRLEFLVKFPSEGVFPFADLILDLFNEKVLNASSVSFMIYEAEDIKREELIDLIGEANISPMMWKPRRYKRQELLELSAVSIPANPRALQVDASFGKAISSYAMSKGIETDDSLLDIVLNQRFIEVDEKVKERTMNEIEELTVKGAELEEEGPEMVQVPKEYEEILKPYPNEHACRLNSPSKYDSFNRKNCAQKHNGKCIDVIYGIKDGKSEIQALRFKKDIWTESAARTVCRDRGGTFEAAADNAMEPDAAYSKEGFLQTDGEKPYKGEYGVTIGNLNDYSEFVRKNKVFDHEGKRVDVIYGLKGDESAVPIEYRLRVSEWDEQAAKNFCESKGGDFEPAAEYKKYTEEELKEIAITGTAFIEEIRELDSELADEIERLVGKELVGVKLPMSTRDDVGSELAEMKSKLSELTEAVKQIAAKSEEKKGLQLKTSSHINAHELMLFGEDDVYKARKQRRRGVIKQLTNVVEKLSSEIDRR